MSGSPQFGLYPLSIAADPSFIAFQAFHICLRTVQLVKESAKEVDTKKYWKISFFLFSNFSLLWVTEKFAIVYLCFGFTLRSIFVRP